MNLNVNGVSRSNIRLSVVMNRYVYVCIYSMYIQYIYIVCIYSMYICLLQLVRRLDQTGYFWRKPMSTVGLIQKEKNSNLHYLLLIQLYFSEVSINAKLLMYTRIDTVYVHSFIQDCKDSTCNEVGPNCKQVPVKRPVHSCTREPRRICTQVYFCFQSSIKHDYERHLC